jgi:Flp pilus assembly protein TadB
MIPQVSDTLAQLFTKTKEEAKELGRKIRRTANILLFTASGLIAVSLASFLIISGPIAIILGTAVVVKGLYELARNWNIIKSGKAEDIDLMKEQVEEGVSLRDSVID